MNAKEKSMPLKAVILAAGVGSRIRPLTDNCPKSLLSIGGKTILEMMITNIQQCGISEIILVLGYLQDQIRDFVRQKFPDIKVTFVVNEKYAETNTGYSLMLAERLVNGSPFIKFDADVVFDKAILKTLIESDYKNCLCVDKNIQLDAEEIKVILKENNRIVKASKTVNPKEAAGESIGIEKIDSETAVRLFAELTLMMRDKNNHQEYYEGAYERLMGQQVPFHALDITGLKWVEIDTKEDYHLAETIFNESNR